MRADQSFLNNQSINQQQQQSSLPLINCQCLHGVASYSCHWLWFVFSPQWLLTAELFLSLLLKRHNLDGALNIILLRLFSTKQFFFFKSLCPRCDFLWLSEQKKSQRMRFFFLFSDRWGNVRVFKELKNRFLLFFCIYRLCLECRVCVGLWLIYPVVLNVSLHVRTAIGT